MTTPSELVIEEFNNAHTYIAEATAQLGLFTDQLNLAVQTAPLVDLTFSSIPEPTAGTLGAYTAPPDYASGILTTLASVLTTRLTGGTGIVPAVESAIWDRARDRETASAQAAIDDATRSAEALGWELPPGVLTDSVRRETRKLYDKLSELSRDVAIKQADLEQSNALKAVDQAREYESTLVDILTKRSQVSLDQYKAQLQKFQAEVEQDIKFWEVSIKQYEAQQNYILAASKMNTEITRANLATLLEAAKTGAQVYSNLVSSAYNMIHASAAVSATAANTVGYSYSNDTLTAPASVTAV